MSDLERVVQSDICKVVDELKRCTSRELYYDLVAKLYYLFELVELKELKIDIPKEANYEYSKRDNEPRKLDFEKSYFSDAANNYSYNLKLAKISDKLMSRYIYDGKYITLRYVPFETSLGLAEKFLKHFDENIYNHFMNLINSPRFVLIKDAGNYEGWQLRNNYLVDSYTIIIPSFYITDFVSIIHETMHSYNFEMIKNCLIKEQDNITKNALYEAPSFFIEHVGLDYLKMINYNIDEIEKLKSMFDKELIIQLGTYKQLLENEYVEFSEYLYYETYCYGRILSYHFYDNFLKDSKKTLENIKKFMYDYKNYDRDYLLNNYGLNKSSIINPQKLTKYMDKHLMRVDYE